MTGLRPPLGLIAVGALMLWHAHALAQTPGHPLREALAAAQQAEAEGEWARAELWLERALLLQPENAQARFDWARLLLRRGERETGLALLDSLVTDPRTTEAQRRRLMALMDDLRRSSPLATIANPNTPEPAPRVGSHPGSPPGSPPRSTSTPAIRQIWETSIGYSHNPLAQSSVREVALTLPQGNLLLPLESRPQAAAVGGLRATLESSQGWLLQSQLQGVAGQGVPSLRVGALWAPGGWWGVYAHAQRLADATRRAQAGFQAVKSLNTASTDTAASNTALIGQISLYNEPDIPRQGQGLRAMLLHSPNAQWNVSAWVETETRRGTSGPPGWVQAAAQVEFKPRNHINLSAQVLDHKDTSGYSPLLENNVPRRMKTLNAQLEWRFGPQPQEGWALRAHAGRRLSNLPLFAWEDAGLTVLWRTSR
jgi:hypothetical protein